MYYLKREQLINKSLNEVFEFFEKPENLAKITPPNVGFNILNTGPLIMKRGAEFKYIINIYGVKMKWLTLISHYNPPYSFTDVQLKGPYKIWEHTHTFEEVNGKVLMKDTVKYDFYGGIFRPVINYLFIQPVLNKIFRFRMDFINNYFK